MPTDNREILRSSKDSKELQTTALALSRSQSEADLEEIRKQLSREEFLMRLDSAEAYKEQPGRLRLRRVLEALKTNGHPQAPKVLAALTLTQAFKENASRADLLIEACAAVRPAPPEVIRYWDEHCQPEDGFTHLTVEALVENGSAPAMALLEKKFADPQHPDEDKTSWLVTSVMTHRNDLELLRSCERLLSGGLAPALTPVLIDALFDYKPAEWFGPATLLKPPERRLASKESLLQLKKNGQVALQKAKPTPAQKQQIEKTIEEISKQLK